MTKFAVLSDLHLEFGWFDIKPLFDVDTSAFICGGDVYPGPQMVEQLLDLGMHVFVVPGNHDFYGYNMQEMRQKWRENSRLTNVTVLDNQVVNFQGVRLIGSTLWTDFKIDCRPELSDEENLAKYRTSRNMVEMSLNDFRRIRYTDSQRRFRADDAEKEFYTNIDFLEAELATPTNCRATIVITHHAPHPIAISSEYRGDMLNGGFTSDLRPLIRKYQPTCWIWSHTHYSTMGQEGETMLLSNQRGYPGENKWKMNYVEF